MDIRGWYAALLAGALGLGTACAPNDPFDFGGPRSCEIPDQNAWVYELMQQVYLFADDLEERDDFDPSAFDSPHEMVAELRVHPDRWSRVSDRGRTDALFQEGKTIGFGFRTRRDTDDRVVIAEITANSPASAAGMARGDVLTSIGGVTTQKLDEDGGWSGIYGETVPGVTIDIEVQSPDQSPRPMTLTKDWIDIDTVPLHGVYDVDGTPVGYLMFATFVEPANAALDAAFEEFRAGGVEHVVVDLRYNSGGLISVARHFMHLLAGSVARGRTAYRVRFNERYSNEDDERTLQDLPQSLDRVQRVVFITTGSSLSASELLINSVAPHVDVSVVGTTTGGKPVGSRHFDFCDSVAVPITFRLVNADEYGDYYEGLTPDCPASDDLRHPLGDPQEASLAVALHRAVTGTCIEDPAGEAATVDEDLGRLHTDPDPDAPVELSGLR